MPLPSRDEWMVRLRQLGIRIDPGGLDDQIGQFLRTIAQTSGFDRYLALGGLQKLIGSQLGRGQAYSNGLPGHVDDLVPDLMNALQDTGLFVGQNEFATIGGTGQDCPFIFSTGFFACMGLVLHDSKRHIATLAHVAPATAAVMSVERLVTDFMAAGGKTGDPATTGYIFGGREGEVHQVKRKALKEALGPAAGAIRHVPLSELGVDNGWGFRFNRLTGSFGTVMGSPLIGTIQGQPVLSVVSWARKNSNTSNDNKGSAAQLLAANRDF